MTGTGNSCKVIIDSNIWVSFLIGKRLYRLVQYVRNERITIVTCEKQLQELAEVFQKPKLQKYFKADRIAIFFAFLKGVSLIIPIATIAPLCRDPKDDYLLALAIASDAQYLVTGDMDLLELQHIQNTMIVKFAHFEEIMNLLV